MQPKPATKKSPLIATATGTTAKGQPWTVLTGDVALALREIATESVDCVVTSPPYYWQRDYEVTGQIGHEGTIEGYVTALVRAFAELRRTLKPDGTFFLNLGDTYYSAKGRPHGKDDKHNGRQMMRRHLRAVDGPGLGLPRKSLIGIPWRVALALQDDGWTLRSSIIWQRPASLPEPTAHDRPWRTFEHVFLFSKGPRYWFDRAGLVGEEDIWEIVERCLDCGCRPGGVVLDPFAGSGTTLVTALSRGCGAIGVDLKPEYSRYTVDRIIRDFGAQAPGPRA
jgi:DNA modification methylase